MTERDMHSGLLDDKNEVDEDFDLWWLEIEGRVVDTQDPIVERVVTLKNGLSYSVIEEKKSGKVLSVVPYDSKQRDLPTEELESGCELVEREVGNQETGEVWPVVVDDRSARMWLINPKKMAEDAGNAGMIEEDEVFEDTGDGLPDWVFLTNGKINYDQ